MATKSRTSRTKQKSGKPAAKRPARMATTAPAPTVSAPASEKAQLTLRARLRPGSLHTWNLALAGLHFMQGVVVLILSTSKLFPVTTNFMAVDPLQTAAQGKTVLAPATHHLFDINLAYLVAAFFFLSAAAHLFLATRYRRQYEAGLQQGINRVRWYEYSLSASTMMVAIGLLAGVQDLSLLLALFGCTAVMNLCGLVMETHNRAGQQVRWLSYIVGSIAGIIPWLAVGVYLYGGAVYGTSAPAFVYWIFGSMFVAFSCFAVNMLLQYRRRGRWAEYAYGERVYMVLSLVAKTLLAWQVFAGTLRP